MREFHANAERSEGYTPGSPRRTDTPRKKTPYQKQKRQKTNKKERKRQRCRKAGEKEKEREDEREGQLLFARREIEGSRFT